MKAVVLKNVTNVMDIKLEEIEKPKCVKGFLVIKILGFGMNHSELILRTKEISATEKTKS